MVYSCYNTNIYGHLSDNTGNMPVHSKRFQGRISFNLLYRNHSLLRNMDKHIVAVDMGFASTTDDIPDCYIIC